MPLEQSRFAGLIPHRGRMCLIDRVLHHDDQEIVCASDSHRREQHPLATGEGRLGAVISLEYAAQAAAIHGGLLAEHAGTAAKPGFLAGARDLMLHCDCLDDLDAELIVKAWRLVLTETSLLYGFAVRCADRPIADGRLSVFFTA